MNLGAFWSEMIESSQNQLLISDNSLPQFVELCTISLPQWVQMTVSFIHRHQDCRHCSLSAPGELSRMLHSMQLIAQLHRRSQKGFQLMTQAGFLTNSCLKRGNCHRDSGRITGKIVHLSNCSFAFAFDWHKQGLFTTHGMIWQWHLHLQKSTETLLSNLCRSDGLKLSEWHATNFQRLDSSDDLSNIIEICFLSMPLISFPPRGAMSASPMILKWSNDFSEPQQLSHNCSKMCFNLSFNSLILFESFTVTSQHGQIIMNSAAKSHNKWHAFDHTQTPQRHMPLGSQSKWKMEKGCQPKEHATAQVQTFINSHNLNEAWDINTSQCDTMHLRQKLLRSDWTVNTKMTGLPPVFCVFDLGQAWAQPEQMLGGKVGSSPDSYLPSPCHDMCPPCWFHWLCVHCTPHHDNTNTIVTSQHSLRKKPLGWLWHALSAAGKAHSAVEPC